MRMGNRRKETGEAYYGTQGQFLLFWIEISYQFLGGF